MMSRNTKHVKGAFMQGIRESILRNHNHKPGVAHITRRRHHHLPGSVRANAGRHTLNALRAPGVTIHLSRPLNVPVSDGTLEGDIARNKEIEKRILAVAGLVSKNAGAITKYALMEAVASVRDDTVRGIPGEPYYLSALKQGIAETAEEDAAAHKFVTSMVADRYVSMMKAKRETEKERMELELELIAIVSEWENIVSFLREHPRHRDRSRLIERINELSEAKTYVDFKIKDIDDFQIINGEHRFVSEAPVPLFGGRRRMTRRQRRRQ